LQVRDAKKKACRGKDPFKNQMKQMKAGEITDDVSEYVWRTCELDDAYCIMLAGQK
jgi:hypothetical protein